MNYKYIILVHSIVKKLHNHTKYQIKMDWKRVNLNAS